jgi:hypothetical protein
MTNLPLVSFFEVDVPVIRYLSFGENIQFVLVKEIDD